MSTFSVGQTLAGGYRIIDVKTGGMGVVYICHQSGTGQFYAIKTVKFHSDQEAEELARRFRNEVFEWIKISNEHKHDNVVQALLYNQDERWLFLEFVDGLPMHRTMPSCAAHPRHALDWAHGMARGMDHLHREFSYLHRDLKPQNVMISIDGLVPKITDMGIGKVLREGMSGHTLIGTPGYMAPECFRGQTDFRADVYSFGAVVYRMVSGDAPFDRTPSFDRLPAAPSEKMPGLPEELDRFVLGCLEPDPGKRFQSFEDVLGELERLPTLSETRTAQDYELCEEHRFFSPVSAELSGCLFCDHARRHEERMQEATRAAEQFADEVDTIPLGDGSRSGDETWAEVTEDLAAARRRPQVEVIPPGPVSRLKQSVMIIVLVALTIGAAVGINAIFNSGGPPPLPSPTVVECEAEGCERKFSLDSAWFRDNDGIVQKSPQSICPADHHWACDECYKRYEKRRSLSDPCEHCKRTRTVVLISLATDKGWFPPPEPPDEPK